MKKASVLLFIGCIFLVAEPGIAQDFDIEASIDRGRTIYSSNCVACHMANGNGIPGVYPALAGADSLISDVREMADWILNGDEVNGVSHSFSLSDRETSDLMNYIRNSWGNEEEAVLPEEVASVKAEEN